MQVYLREQQKWIQDSPQVGHRPCEGANPKFCPNEKILKNPKKKFERGEGA